MPASKKSKKLNATVAKKNALLDSIGAEKDSKKKKELMKRAGKITIPVDKKKVK